jgi:hypothetical protein
MKPSAAKRKPEPQEPKSAPIPLESIEDAAWELWLLVELLAPVRLIANSVVLAKWKKARPELFPNSPAAARDVLPGENWVFPDHRTLAEVIETERKIA